MSLLTKKYRETRSKNDIAEARTAMGFKTNLDILDFKNGKFNYRDKEYGSEEDFWADYEYDLAASRQANTDEDKLERAIEMAVSENIGYENNISGLIWNTRARYDGDATDEEIADKLKHELENRGFDYVDDLLESIRDSYINDTIKELLS